MNSDDINSVDVYGRRVVPAYSDPSEADLDPVPVLERRIQELLDELSLYKETQYFRPFQHRSSNLMTSFGLDEEEFDELCKVIDSLMKKKYNPSQIMEYIEGAPIPLRAKLVAMTILGTLIKPKTPQSPMDGLVAMLGGFNR